MMLDWLSFLPPHQILVITPTTHLCILDPHKAFACLHTIMIRYTEDMRQCLSRLCSDGMCVVINGSVSIHRDTPVGFSP